MIRDVYYHGLLRKYVVLFGTLFNDIYVNRPATANNNLIQSLRVPITYAPKEKMLARLATDPALDKPVAMTLPRMSFEMTSMSYASDRKLPTTTRNIAANTVGNTPDKSRSQYMPVPYDINFTLQIYVKNAEDGTRILEQILPYFTPDWTVTAVLIPEMGLSMDIPITLTSMSSEDTYEGNFEERRALIWQIDFVMKTYVYGPIKNRAIIKFANTSLNDLVSNTLLTHITVTPGLTANGLPTSNAAASIPYTEIYATDDYGFITQITDT